MGTADTFQRENQWPTRTFHSRIISVVTEGSYLTNPIVSAVEYTTLILRATDIIKPDWSSCAAIEGVEAWDCTLVDKHSKGTKIITK